MTDQDKEYLRDLFAGFAMCGWIIRSEFPQDEGMAQVAYAIADQMMEAREHKNVGIKAMRRRKPVK